MPQVDQDRLESLKAGLLASVIITVLFGLLWLVQTIVPWPFLRASSWLF